MKRRIKSLFLAFAVLISSIPMTMSVVAEDTLPSYNAYDEFSAADNPSGVWTYQYRSDKTVSTTDESSYKNMVQEITNGVASETSIKNSNSGTLLAIIIKTTNAFNSQSSGGALRLEPRTTDAEAIVTFTAPYSGCIRFSMANGGVYTNGSGLYNFVVLHNGTEVSGTRVDNLASGGANFSDSIDLTVAKGDTIRFVVGAKTAYQSGCVTLLNPQVTYTTVSESIPSYNAYDDFSANDNPNLPWRYQYRVMENDSYVYYDLSKDLREGKDNTWNTNDYAEIAKTQGDQVTSLTNDVLCLAPWTNEHQAVLTFVAPYSGKVDISMTNGGVFAPHQDADGVSFWLLQNENEVISVSNLDTDYNAEGSRFFAETKNLSVEEGDVIRFVVGRNSSLDGRTYFNPQITYTVIEEKLPLYNAYDDFSTEYNPNLPWQYQYRATENGNYVYTNMVDSTTSSTSDANLTGKWSKESTASIAKTQGDKVISNTCNILEMAAHNETHQAVLTFVAPYSGAVNISMTNGGVFAPYQSQDAVSFWLLHNETEVISVSDLDSSYNHTPAQGDSYVGRFFTEAVSLNVEAGDEIRFVVGRNSTNDGRTYFNPQIEYTTVDDMEGIPISVESLNDIEAVKGTQAENLNLPQTVNVTYSDTTIKQVGINWDTSNYSPEIGKYVLTGTLDVENNPKELSVTINVEVKAEGAVYETYKVWEYGELDGIMTYHQFGLFTTSKRTLLAAAEARTSVADAGAPHHIVLKRSSDGGKTWGDTIIVANYNDTINGVTNICYADANVVEDSETGKLFLFYAANLEDTSILYYKVSTDDGLTWGEAVDVSSLFANDPYERTFHRTGAGHGLQIQNGQYAGRLLIYIDHANAGTTVAERKYGISVIYSDDGGTTWNNSAYTEPIGLGEGRIAELEDGTLVINSRNSANGTTSENYRYQLVSTDGGATWSTPRAWKSLGKMYGCDASLYTDVQEGVTRMLFSSIEMNNPVRNNLQIRLSYDAGATWSYQKELWRDNSITAGNGDQNSDITKAGTGASDISKISDSTYGVLHGTTVVNNDVEIVIFNLAWLTDGADESSDINGVQSLKTEFNGYDDFSAEYNPNLPWKYQYRVLENESYVYYNLQDSATSDAADEKITGQWKTNGVGTISKTQGDMVFSSKCNVLGLAPTQNNDDIVLTFVAPYSGEICISTENIAVFAPYQSSDGISFSLLHNEKEIVAVSDLDTDYNTVGNRFFTGTETLIVEAGDVIRFVVGRNGDVDGRTYFNPDIVYTKIDMQGMNLDVNADREINSKDAEELRKILVTASDITFFDVNGDDVCNVIDLVSLKKYLAKIS